MKTNSLTKTIFFAEKLIYSRNPIVSMSAGMGLTAYELQRVERMKMNQQKLLQMGLADTLNEINTTQKVEQQQRRPAVRPSSRPLTADERRRRRLEIRRSDRCVQRDLTILSLHKL
jgi:hypothetical protein